MVIPCFRRLNNRQTCFCLDNDGASKTDPIITIALFAHPFLFRLY